MKDRECTRIAFVSNTSWSLYNFRIELIRSFISLGIEVYLIAPKDEYSTKLISEGAFFIPLKMNNYSINPSSDLKVLYRLYKLYKDKKFDYIFHYTAKPNIYGSIAARLVGTPSSAITTGLGRLFLFKHRFVYYIALSLYKVAAACTNEIWFLNLSDQKTFINKNIVAPQKTFLLPSEGINIQKFKTLSHAKVSTITRFLFAGRILKDKGIYEFVEAARLCRKTNKKLRFEILGFIDESNPNSITVNEVMCWQKAGWIKYLGSTEDVRRFIDRADCIIFPSYYNEGISRILLEASSMEKPIITTDNVGCAEIIENKKSGFLCEPRSVPDLVRAIQEFLSLPEENRLLMGAEGRAIVKDKYNVEHIVSIYHQKLISYCNPPELNHIKPDLSLTRHTTHFDEFF